MNGRIGTLLVIAIGIAAGAIGCGDNETASSATGAENGLSVTTSSLDKAGFLKQAEAACVRAGKGTLQKVEAFYTKNAPKNASQDELDEIDTQVFKQVVAPIVKDMIVAVRALGAPEGDEEEVEALLVIQQEAVDEVKTAKEIGGMAEFENYFVEATKAFQAYGFNGCMIAGWV